MKGGFTFNNVDIADLFLEYAPELSDTYVFRPTSTTPHDETFDGHTGGYFYGLTKEPKEFILRCFYDEKHINKGIMEKMHWVFRKGNSGKLVFQKRPWCYYYATVIDVDDTEVFNYLNGVIKITMKAYYPFARSDDMYYPSNRLDYFDVMETTAFFDSESMMPAMDIAGESTITSATSFLLYNPGNEFADVGIEIAGNAPTGVIIKNLTTNQECKFIALTSEATTTVNSYVCYDGINGKCILKSPTQANINSLYHDYGCINLAPGYPVTRNIVVSEIDGDTVTVANSVYETDIGKYIYLNSTWQKILDVVDEHTLTIASDNLQDAVQTTVIATMNELVITPVQSMSITRLKFNYKPTFM